VVEAAPATVATAARPHNAANFDHLPVETVSFIGLARNKEIQALIRTLVTGLNGVNASLDGE
jgi:hypothetical protein